MPLVAALWYGDGRLPLGEFALHARDCSAGVVVGIKHIMWAFETKIVQWATY